MEFFLLLSLPLRAMVVQQKGGGVAEVPWLGRWEALLVLQERDGVAHFP